MNFILKLKQKYKQSGPGGVASTVLHHAADYFDRRALGSASSEPGCEEFLSWVRFAVPGMLHPRNVDAMKYALTHMPADKPVVEIGSFCGLSTVVMIHLLQSFPNNVQVFTCDKWEFEGQQPGHALGNSQTVTHDHYQAYVRDTFLRSMRTFAAPRLPYTIECFSDEFFRRWLARESTEDVFGRMVSLGGEIGFCYIDGNHTYEFAKRDFENTDRALVPGGFILFDDSADGSGWEVNRLVHEIAAGGRYELISNNPNFLFRKSLSASFVQLP